LRLLVHGMAGALVPLNAVFDTFREPEGTTQAKTGHSFAQPVSLLYGRLGRVIAESRLCRNSSLAHCERIDLPQTFIIPMSLFNRLLRYNEPAAVESGGAQVDFDALLRISMEELLLKTQAHQDTWLFGKEEQWNLDPGQGELVFSFPGRLAIAPAQIIGTYNGQTGLWTWSWANSSVPESLAAHASHLKEYGEQNSIPRLTTPEWAGEESDCWYMAALACRLCGFHGAYRGPSENLYSFITFGEVKLNPPIEDRAELLKNLALETAGDFRTCAESFDEQRRACCRYFKRGALVGLSQPELIDSLALSAPSVLETAGYPPEAAERVMEMIGGISDDEIQNS
jgi:hypothetical protein